MSPKVARPIWLIAVLCVSPADRPIRFAASSAMCTCAAIASAVMPANIVIESAPMITSVVAALRLFGSSKAGTPFETASTPVSAVQPGGEGAQHEEDKEDPAGIGDVAEVIPGALRSEAIPEEDLRQPHREHREHAEDESVRRQGEGPP